MVIKLILGVDYVGFQICEHSHASSHSHRSETQFRKLSKFTGACTGSRNAGEDLVIWWEARTFLTEFFFWGGVGAETFLTVKKSRNPVHVLVNFEHFLYVHLHNEVVERQSLTGGERKLKGFKD